MVEKMLIRHAACMVCGLVSLYNAMAFSQLPSQSPNPFPCGHTWYVPGMYLDQIGTIRICERVLLIATVF